MITQNELKPDMVFKRQVGLREECIVLIIRNKDIPLDKYGTWAAVDTTSKMLRKVSEAELICSWEFVKKS